jgi:DNA-binding response OmpR family regulator
MAKAELPDLVVSDVMLPGLDGYAVCRELKTSDITSHIPIILLTALQGSDSRIQGLKERPDDYITKPFRENELLERIANLIEIRSMLRRRYGRELRIDSPLPSDMSQSDRNFLDKLAGVCEANHTSSALDIKTLATLLSVSERQLQRKLRALLGLTPTEYLRDYRLQRAHDQLMAGHRPSDVAIAVGFGSHAYFSACFKTKFGYTPDQVTSRETSSS